MEFMKQLSNPLMIVCRTLAESQHLAWDFTFQ